MYCYYLIINFCPFLFSDFSVNSILNLIVRKEIGFAGRKCCISVKYNHTIFRLRDVRDTSQGNIATYLKFIILASFGNNFGNLNYKVKLFQQQPEL